MMIKKWILNHYGIFRGCNMAELEILDNIIHMNIPDGEKDVITDSVKQAIDRNIRGICE